MCGILGFIGNKWQPHAETALETLRSRGPDARAVLDLGEATIAHTRLSVIDLSGGKQPMQSPDGRYTLTYNGEIYNYLELRNTLEKKGVAFLTNSDVEVLLHALIVWGEKALPRLDGMFAFALWDAHKRNLLAARDRIGEKPLMYSTEGRGIIFASTLAPFLVLPEFPHRINANAVRDYLHFDRPTLPHTILQDVKQLPPACVLRFDAKKNQHSIEKWWSIPTAAANADDNDALERVETAIRDSVRRQMISDVPLGAFLSGGIDSSLMVRYMAEFFSGKVKTFSVKFNDAKRDESEYARAVAEKFDTDHHILEADTFTGQDFVEAIGALDQPLADQAYPMTYFLSRQARQHVTVAISGDGGDEVFGGYPEFMDTEDKYPALRWKKPLRQLIALGIRPRKLLRRGLSGKDYLLFKNNAGEWGHNRMSKKFLSPDMVSQIDIGTAKQNWISLIDELGGRMDSGTLMRADLWTDLSESFLVKTDRASMAHGLEVRAPFLGATVLSTALSLPPQTHFQNGLKSILKDLSRHKLPRKVWDRPKQGFDVPVANFMAGAWREVFIEAVAEGGKIAPFLNQSQLRKLHKQTLDGHKLSSVAAWKLPLLIIWLRENRVNL